MPRTIRREANAVVDQGHARADETLAWAYIRAPFGDPREAVPHVTVAAALAWVDIDEEGRVIGVRVNFRTDAERL